MDNNEAGGSMSDYWGKISGYMYPRFNKFPTT